MIVLGAIAYIVMELVIKHFAMRTLQQQIMQLPVIPPPPSLSDVATLPPAPKLFSPPPPMTGPPPALPEPKAMAPPPMAMDDLRSLALEGYY